MQRQISGNEYQKKLNEIKMNKKKAQMFLAVEAENMSDLLRFSRLYESVSEGNSPYHTFNDDGYTLLDIAALNGSLNERTIY